MGASFGAVNGTNAEIAREKANKEEINVSKIVKQGLIEAVINGAAAGGGMGASMHFSGSPSVHINEATGDGSAPKLRLVTNKDGGVSISLSDAAALKAGSKVMRISDIPGLSRSKPTSSIPSDIFGETPSSNPHAEPEPDTSNGADATPETGVKPTLVQPSGPKSASREFVVDSRSNEFKDFRNRKSDGTFLNVRERLLGDDGKEQLGPKKLLFVQKLGTGGEKHPQRPQRPKPIL